MAKSRTRPFLCLLMVFSGTFATANGQGEDAFAADQLEFFEKQVRPLLIKHCYECHSVDATRIEGSLLLDSRKAHLTGGDSGPSVIPGDADGSLLIEAVRYESYEMPPKGQLPQKDIDVLARWVEMGAPWPDEPEPSADSMVHEFDLQQRRSDFWVWQPVQDKAPPSVSHVAWPQNDIDRHILAQLEAAGLKPAVAADRAAILRRLHFDLTGLPPTAQEVSAFVADADDDDRVIERAVDRLLASPHFGERWGRHWLDMVRYAESRGHEFDNDTPNAFQYRDYVIRALNADVPYDQFVREHIAGDLLEKPRLNPDQGFNESVLGTGFWFLGEWVHSPVDIRKDEADRFDNMLDVMSKSFLGVTVACARCHDHKFDAISTADYYSLSGFLQSSDYRQVRFESMEQNRKVAQLLAKTDQKYQRQLLDLLASHGIVPPSQTSYLTDDSIVVDYSRLPQKDFLQDGYIFGQSPRFAGQPYLNELLATSTASVNTTANEKATSPSNSSRKKQKANLKQKTASPNESGSRSKVRFATFAAAVNDPIWSGLESITEGAIQNRSLVARLPKSGRTLRSPTFELTHGLVSCRIDGVGHVVACVDSHRLVAGPLHKQTIVPVRKNQRWVNLKLDRYIGHRLHLEFIPAENEQLSVRMVTQGLSAEDRADLDQRLAANDKSWEAFAQKAEAFLNVFHNRTTSRTQETVFADFESGSYDDWKVTGDAFGQKPHTLNTIAKYQGRINGQGTFFVNSHNVRTGGNVRPSGSASKGDRPTGTLTSPEFLINFDSIEFLVGGGDHKGKTCVNLIIDNKVVRTVTGKRNNQMSLNTWDVSEFAGKKATIQAVDQHTSGWGNIGLDHIVFVKHISPSPKKTPQVVATDGRRNSPADTPIADRETARKVSDIIGQWKQERTKLASQMIRKSRVALAMMDGTGEDDRILIRGNSGKPGAVEPRHFLTAIAGDSPMKIRKGSGRLELAQHINDPSNPLASRVIVNRIWHHLMGRGIVPTVDDFGVLGQRPSHPELLDHLATRFQKQGRSIKQLIKYIVMSETYQLSSHPDPTAVQADPTNKLWHHRPPRRLQGEVIRDSLLALSGRLDTTVSGAPVPIHLTSFMDGRGRPNKSGPLDGNGRRSIYVAVRRNFLSPFMLTFDTPVPFSSMGRRNVSNVPAQALILLNDPLVAELATDWSRLALEAIPGTNAEQIAGRIDWLYLTAFARQPTEQESRTATAFVISQAKKQNISTDTAELWSNLAHALVNTKEFIYLR